MAILGAAVQVVLLGLAAPSSASTWASVAQSSGVYRVEGGFEAQAATATAWAVLTDYDGIAEFVSAMQESRVIERQAGEILVEQEALASFLVFGRQVRVRLRVRERPGLGIAFEDTFLKDFSAYAGAWELKPDGDRVQVSYELAVKPAFRVPGFLTRRALQRATRELLQDVRREILLRETRSQPATGFP